MPEKVGLIYGANGYTGRLVAEEAVRRGAAPILAGRDRSAVQEVAGRLALTARAFSLDDEERLAAGLSGVDAVLHCAGPFLDTSRPMVEACLQAGCHYLDITGEIPVFEGVLRRDETARDAGVALLPGVGFDVVPTDCLAARLAEALPGAEELELAFHSEGGSWSRGTLKTMLQGLPAGGAIRRHGRIVRVPPAWDAREIPFRCGGRRAVTIPWGDVSTAFHTTGIPNVRVYASMPPKAIRRLRRARPLLPLLGLAPVERLLGWWVERTVTGPDAETRREARMHLWGRVAAADGREVTATAVTPEGYSFTATASVEALHRVLAGRVEPGAWTPAKAFGHDFAAQIEGVEMDDPRRSPEPPGPATG